MIVRKNNYQTSPSRNYKKYLEIRIPCSTQNKFMLCLSCAFSARQGRFVPPLRALAEGQLLLGVCIYRLQALAVDSVPIAESRLPERFQASARVRLVLRFQAYFSRMRVSGLWSRKCEICVGIPWLSCTNRAEAFHLPPCNHLPWTCLLKNQPRINRLNLKPTLAVALRQSRATSWEGALTNWATAQKMATRGQNSWNS